MYRNAGMALDRIHYNCAMSAIFTIRGISSGTVAARVGLSSNGMSAVWNKGQMRGLVRAIT
jgi:hypothetical protein